MKTWKEQPRTEQDRYGEETTDGRYNMSRIF